MRVSRRRIKKAKPVGDIIGSYAIVMTVLIAFLLGLFLLVALELLLFG